MEFCCNLVENNCKVTLTEIMRLTMSDSLIAAIAAVDLARELIRHNIVNFDKIRSLNHALATQVAALENGEDISMLLGERYPETWLITLWQWADQDRNQCNIGLKIGRRVNPEAKGLLSSLMQHCDTLDEVLTVYLKNIGLVNASEHWDVYKLPGIRELVFNFSNPGYPRCAIERSMTALHNLAQYYCGQPIPVRSVEFKFPPPDYAYQLESNFRCNIVYNSERHALVFDEKVFNYKLARRNQYIKEIIAEKISCLSFPTQNQPVTQKIRLLLRKDLPRYSNINHLAKTTCMSRSTLYRKLKSEGTNFSGILDEERQRILHQNPNKPIAVLSDLLGFKDSSAYHKARKRWLNNS